MKKMLLLLWTGTLICALGTACNDNDNDRLGNGLGEEIPGIEIKQATGTVIGRFYNGFGSLLLQVEEEFPIGKTIEVPTPPGRWLYTLLPETETGIYSNMIQVQSVLPLENKRISFSYREWDYKNQKKDLELFQLGPAHMYGESEPDVPICVITKYKILND